MGNNLSKRDNEVKEKISGWDKAIESAEMNIERLKTAIGHFRDMKAAGIAWPGDQTGTPEHGK